MKTLYCSAKPSLVLRVLPAGADSGRRIMQGEAVSAYGSSHDGKWEYVVAPAGAGWASAEYLAAAPVAPAKPAAPSGIAAIKARFGEPGAKLATDGIVALPFPLPLGWELDTKISSFKCHPLAAEPFYRAFKKVYERGLWPHLRTFDGCYNDRPTKLGGKTSTHAWGISIDLNAATNRQGKPGDMHPGIVEAFREEGFEWGGDFSGASRDDMHFQLAKGY